MKKIAQNYVTEKCVISGNKIEFYRYSIPYKIDFEKRTSVVDLSSFIEKEKRIDNLSRARQSVRRLIWCNLTPHTKFLTLTTKENISDRKVFKRMFTTFLQQMKRYGYPLKYLYVLEYQKRGALHAHLVVFNDEKIPLKILKKAWHYGRSDIKMLNGLKYGSNEKVNDVGAYVCKYITKDTVENLGEHCYECSQGLNRPITFNLRSAGELGTIGLFELPNNDENDCYKYFKENIKCEWKGTKFIEFGEDNKSYQIIEYSQGILNKDIGMCK